MKIKLFKLIVVVLLISFSISLHLQLQQPYDPYKYYDSLQEKQQALKQDLQQIQNMFKQIDSSLSSQANNPSKKLQILQEGLADQRDSLISIEQYLNLPLQQRSCQCMNFTDEMKAKLQTQLDKVKQSVQEIQANTNECADCEFIIEIKKQIQQQKNYLKIMEDTLKAKCCVIYQTLYKDDLSSSNWKYGNQTQDQYNQEINKIGASMDDVLVKPCPIATPYATQNYTHCTNCDEPNKMFNLKTRQCQQCQTGKIFNYQKHKCQIVCPPGTFLNQELEECQQIIPDFNSSTCPEDKPIWDPQVLGCFRCPHDKPLYISSTKTCIQCPENYNYIIEIGQCIHEQCNAGEYFDPVTSTCKKNEQLTDSSSSCPSQKPYWDPNSLSCTSCPPEKPKYNRSLKKCQTCPDNTIYAEIYERCVEKCSQGQVLNHITWKCVNITSPDSQSSDGDVSSQCPPEKPIWNSDSKSCSRCSELEPYWNSQLQKCQKCQSDEHWNTITSRCQKNQIVCPDNQIYSVAQGKCVPQDNNSDTAGLCAPETPYYNPQTKSCSECPPNMPYYNQTAHVCQEKQIVPEQNNDKNEGTVGLCPPNSKYDQINKICVEENTQEPTTQPQPEQPLGGGKAALCPPEAPIWNSDLLVCQQCPENSQWDANKKICSETSPEPPALVIPKQCPSGMQLNKNTNQCENCRAWQIYVASTKSCKAVCKIGQVYHPIEQICAGTMSSCPIGLVWDASHLDCFCPEGKNYRYLKDERKCEEFCKQNELYDVIDEKCVLY